MKLNNPNSYYIYLISLSILTAVVVVGFYLLIHSWL